MLFSLLIVEVKGIAKQGRVHQKIGNTIGLLKESTFRKVILIGVLILLGKDIYTAFVSFIRIRVWTFQLYDEE
ncbi:hypothetical protein UACE39S_05430 [Ureibacillus acetophenoni]